MKTLALATLALFLSPLGACSQGEPSRPIAPPAVRAETTSVADEDRVPYRFGEPIASFSLPEDLREISALTVLDEQHLGAVQDEEGRLFVLDLETGQVTLVLPFGPPGDYEGVELAGSRLFMLRADGTLFELEGWEGGETRTREIASGLEADCDAEGLGFDEARNRLLIACKAGGEESGGRRAIYSFDLERMALDAQPAFVIDPEHVEGERKLAPSALAVHPVTGHVVVLSSAREVLVALAPDGTVADVWDWTEAGFEQPEGLAFLPNGDLFIASEGDERAPVLTRFAYRGAP